MTVGRIIAFSQDDTALLEKFRTNILAPMCDTVSKECGNCPFNGYCLDLKEFLDYSITNKQYIID